MITRYRYSSPIGMFRIELRQGQSLWRVVLGQRMLGQFRTPEEALAALVQGGLTGWPDPLEAGVPQTLSAWSRRPAPQRTAGGAVEG